MIPSDWDCVANDEPVCPYCGEPQGDFWEVRGDDGYHDCDSCSRRFAWSREVSVSYSTDPIVGPHQLNDFFQHEDAQEKA